MNTVRIFICATFALLIAALVHSYSTKREPADKSLKELREEYEKVKLENQIKRERAAGNTAQYNPLVQPTNIAPVTAAPIINPAPPAPFLTPETPSTTDVNTVQIEALKAENAKLKKQHSLQKSENNMLNAEAGAIQRELSIRNKPEEARASQIAQALVMARVKVYDPESGIIVLDLERAQNLTPGQILGIRRGTTGGIWGRIKLGNIESSELGYADPIPQSFFGGNIDVQVGDEIIVIP